MCGFIRRLGGLNLDIYYSKIIEKSKCYWVNKIIIIILVEKRNLDLCIVFILLNCCKVCVLFFFFK